MFAAALYTNAAVIYTLAAASDIFTAALNAFAAMKYTNAACVCYFFGGLVKGIAVTNLCSGLPAL